MTAVPFVARCTEVRTFGRMQAQCLLSPAPHPQQPCWFGVDAEVYGRPLDKQPTWWLVEQLRDAQAQLRYERSRVTALTAIAAQLAGLASEGAKVARSTGEWVRMNLPVVAQILDLDHGRWSE
jgi:hypothetical protein